MCRTAHRTNSNDAFDIFKFEDARTKAEWIDEMLATFTLKVVKGSAKIKVQYTGEEGVNVIREALSLVSKVRPDDGDGVGAVLGDGEGDPAVIVRVDAPPVYLLTCESVFEEQVVHLLDTAIKAVRDFMAKYDQKVEVVSRAHEKAGNDDEDD